MDKNDPAQDDPPDSEQGGEGEDLLGAHEPNRAAASAACSAAVDAYEASAGTDSAALLMAAEEASAAARAACLAAEATSATLRGAETPADPKPATKAPVMPPASAIARAATAPTAQAHLEAARLVSLGRDVMARTKATTTEGALLKLEAGLTALGEVAKLRAAETARAAKDVASAKHDRLAAAVRAGMPRAQAFVVSAGVGKDGKPIEVLTAKACWTRGSLAELDEQLTEMGYSVGANTRHEAYQPAGADGDSGLAARAKASGMDIETRRAAEANQARSAAQESSR